MSIDTFVAGIQNQDLRIPSSHYDAVRRFTMTRTNEEGAKNPDQSPFNRYVDLWWVAMCIGAQENKRTTATDWHTFVRAGEVLPSNPWRILQTSTSWVRIYREHGNFYTIQGNSLRLQMSWLQLACL